jgi:FtsP/CotA-like multicopper oxidase with cupredoxin domain
MDNQNPASMNRRDLLKLGGGLLAASATALRGRPAEAGQMPRDGFVPCTDGGPLYQEVYPTSPFVLEPFTEELPNPSPMAPSNPNDWVKNPRWAGTSDWDRPSPSRSDCDWASHQLWPNQIGYPEPLYYRIKLQVGQHMFHRKPVLPIRRDGRPVSELDLANGYPTYGKQPLPPSTIYGFNGTFPGPMIYARYGQPVSLRLENDLAFNDGGFDRVDFGSPEWGFLTHLHNGHTAAESDGNPNFRDHGYYPEQWCDNLYLNYPPGNDPGEKQSFLWFHDHYMHHTGANVYKGMVGLYYVYDPVLDPGDERLGLRLPGVPGGPGGRVEYDIPLAFYDVAIDDGVTEHRDAHNGCGEKHPEWWGMHSFRHFPNHGWVGDVFTTNCVAYPVLKVKRRKYRLRFLGASIARIYEFSFMSSSNGPVPAGLDAEGEAAYRADSQGFLNGTSAINVNNANWDSSQAKRQGQWRIRDGQQCLQGHQIATDGGLLPFAQIRNRWEIWPAKRREFVVDFSQYMDGTPTTGGDVIWLVNTYQMTNGRKRTEKDRVKVDALGNELVPLQFEPNPDYEPNFCVPMMKIVIDGNDRPVDNSRFPTQLRPLPVINMKKLKQLPTRHFRLERGGTFGGETEWLINGEQFHKGHNLAFPKLGVPEVWTIENGGGGWVHPMHMHYEEHRVISRNGIPTPLDPKHPDDNSREDVVALEPGEVVVIYRNFRTFAGPYVAHCHNLAHEDHNMMFGFEVQA